MLGHVLVCLPEEACGVLGGRDGQVEQVALVTNRLHSPVRFQMAPEEQLRAFQQIEAQGLEIIAFFHSHPTGPPFPSETDRREFAYPGVLALVWSPEKNGWQARAFQLDGGEVVETPLVRIFDGQP